MRSHEPVAFRALLLRPAEGGDWTFLRLPPEASGALPSRGQVSIEGTLNGTAFATTLQPDGEGGHWLRVVSDLRTAAGVQAGEEVALDICPVKIEPEPEVPQDLQEALAANSAALAVWTATTAVARRDWVQWMTTGKKAETRTIRREKMMDMLAKGKRRVCCFDNSGMYSKELSCPLAADE